jgi:hypothetical protein
MRADPVGQVRPKRVAISGAGLRLSRDGPAIRPRPVGRGGASRVSLPETMARLDAMFAAPAFDALEEVTATGCNCPWPTP